MALSPQPRLTPMAQRNWERGERGVALSPQTLLSPSAQPDWERGALGGEGDKTPGGEGDK